MIFKGIPLNVYLAAWLLVCKFKGLGIAIRGVLFGIEKISPMYFLKWIKPFCVVLLL